jgi:hypothetical protein
VELVYRDFFVQITFQTISPFINFLKQQKETIRNNQKQIKIFRKYVKNLRHKTTAHLLQFRNKSYAQLIHRVNIYQTTIGELR